MKRSLCFLVGLALPALAFAHGGSDAAKRGIEASMVVTGTITVNPDGSVQGFTIHELEKLPPAARQIVQATVPRWQFVPITANGKAIAAETGMSLRIVADWQSIHAKQATIRVDGAAFGCDGALAREAMPDACPAGSTVTYSRVEPPRYPYSAALGEVGGEVFLVLQIGRDGHVRRAAVRRVNLYTRTEYPVQYRAILGEASLEAAWKWQFRVPTSGPGAGKDQWVVQVPVIYGLDWVLDHFGFPRRPRFRYGKWNVYIPGPVVNIPWADESDGPRIGADAIPDSGTPFMSDVRFLLKTPFNGRGSGKS